MACTLIPMDGSEGCAESDGGLRVSYVAPCEAIDDFTFTGNVVSAITMAGGASFSKFLYDDDGTSSYNQEGERTNNRHVFNQTMTGKFSGLDEDKTDAGNAIRKCCCLIAVHFFNNGKAFIQGIQKDPDSTDWTLARRKAKATVSAMSDTDENEDRLDLQIISQAKFLSPATSLDEGAIEAL